MAVYGYGKDAHMILIIGGAFQGKTEYAKSQFDSGYKIVNRYHLKVKEQLQNGQNPLKEAEKLLTQEDKLVIISDEIGYGLVPVDVFEREYREASGRVNCYLAREAEQVIRMVSGIATRIK